MLRCSVAPLTFMLAIWQSVCVAARELLLLLLLSCCQCNRILICHVGWDVLSPMRRLCVALTVQPKPLGTFWQQLLWLFSLLFTLMSCSRASWQSNAPLPLLHLPHTHIRTSLASASSKRQGRAGELHIQERSLTRTCTEMKINALEVHVVRTLTEIHRQPQHKLATNPQNSKPQSGRPYLSLPLPLPPPGPAQCDPADLACVLLSSWAQIWHVIVLSLCL